MIFDNVMIKIKQIPEIPQEQREKYGKELEYIKKSVDNVNDVLKSSQSLNSDIEKVHNKCLELHKAVDTCGAQYTQLNEAIQRFKNCISDISTLNTDIEKAWNGLSECEAKIQIKAPTPAIVEEKVA